MNTNRALWPGKYCKSIEMYTRALCQFPSERDRKTVSSNPKQTVDDWISALPFHQLPTPAAPPVLMSQHERQPRREAWTSEHWKLIAAISSLLHVISRKCVIVLMCTSGTDWNVDFTLIIFCRRSQENKKCCCIHTGEWCSYPTAALSAVLTLNASLLLIKQATLTPFKH